MLNDENLVEKEGMVDANVNDTIDGNCFVCCPPPLKMTGSPKKNNNNNNNNNNERWKRIGKAKKNLWVL